MHFITLKKKRKNMGKHPTHTAPITVRFITIMQRYSGQREIQMDLPPDPNQALKITTNNKDFKRYLDEPKTP